MIDKAVRIAQDAQSRSKKLKCNSLKQKVNELAEKITISFQRDIGPFFGEKICFFKKG